MTAPDVNRLLRLHSWFRLGLAELLLIIAPLMPAGLMPGANTGILALALLVVVLSSGALLLLGPLAQPRRTAWLMSLLDMVLVTAVVAATGGPRSIYSFLYVLSVTAACVLLPRLGALIMAATGSLLYTGLVFARTVFPITAFLEPPQETTALEVLTMFLNSGTFLIVAIVAGGIAEQHRATRRELETQRRDLLDLQAFKAVILNSVGTGLIVLDRDHAVTALNRAAEAITGRRAAETISRPWSALLGEAVPLGAIEAAITGNPTASPRHETTLERPDGSRVPVRLTFSALRTGDGSRLGLIGVCEDLSEIREMEARMRQADRLATLGRMAANIAHEIRNPLASLTGAIEALTGPVAAGEERERLTQIVSRESDRLNRIIKDFLEYARPAPLALEAVNVAEVLDEVLVLLEHRDLPPNLKIARDFPPSLPWRLDAQQFRQALWNLCLNAVEAMPAGGELRVAATTHRRALHVTVADSGEGIAPGDLPHVFEPFFSTKPGGSGLGLALVHRIVRDHGGDLDVRSSPGLGTTVTLTFAAASG
ncbi:MAG: PAS domain S-box protein [Candidatus Rokubacteria bacterium]|nr:PAS domain S-box protein [Candidatus Rokubacteria bacterium]MBI4593135.1 PAS domain S-box protein [Candidatus Rokubacteria bacterium]